MMTIACTADVVRTVMMTIACTADVVPFTMKNAAFA